MFAQARCDMANARKDAEERTRTKTGPARRKRAAEAGEAHDRTERSPDVEWKYQWSPWARKNPARARASSSVRPGRAQCGTGAAASTCRTRLAELAGRADEIDTVEKPNDGMG